MKKLALWGTLALTLALGFGFSANKLAEVEPPYSIVKHSVAEVEPPYGLIIYKPVAQIEPPYSAPRHA